MLAKYTGITLHSTAPKKLNKNKEPSKEVSISLKRGNGIVVGGRWREGSWKGGEIRCGEGQEKCPDGHANVRKSTTDRHEVVAIFRMIPGQKQGR